MKKKFYSIMVFSLVASIALFSGCKKDSINGKVKSITSSSTGTASSTTTFTYDGQGRLISQQGATSTSSISYSQSTVTISTTGGATTIYTLNPQGYIASSNNGAVNYAYDDAGFLTTETAGANSLRRTISNGDIQSETTIINGSTTTTTYTRMSNVDYRDFGLSFQGRSSTHLANTEIVTSNGSSVTYTYGYNFDGQGRVINETITSSAGNITTNTYNY